MTVETVGLLLLVAVIVVHGALSALVTALLNLMRTLHRFVIGIVTIIVVVSSLKHGSAPAAV